MGKRIQYTGTTEEKQPSCAFRADFGTKRYVYPLSFALLSRFPKGTAEPSQSRLTACQIPPFVATRHLPTLWGVTQFVKP